MPTSKRGSLDPVPKKKKGDKPVSKKPSTIKKLKGNRVSKTSKKNPPPKGFISQSARTGNQTTTINIQNALAKAMRRSNRRYVGIPRIPHYSGGGGGTSLNIQFPSFAANHDNGMHEVMNMRNDIINEFRRLHPYEQIAQPAVPLAQAEFPIPDMEHHPDVVYSAGSEEVPAHPNPPVAPSHAGTAPMSIDEPEQNGQPPASDVNLSQQNSINGHTRSVPAPVRPTNVDNMSGPSDANSHGYPGNSVNENSMRNYPLHPENPATQNPPVNPIFPDRVDEPFSELGGPPPQRQTSGNRSSSSENFYGSTAKVFPDRVEEPFSEIGGPPSQRPNYSNAATQRATSNRPPYIGTLPGVPLTGTGIQSNQNRSRVQQQMRSYNELDGQESGRLPDDEHARILREQTAAQNYETESEDNIRPPRRGPRASLEPNDQRKMLEVVAGNEPTVPPLNATEFPSVPGGLSDLLGNDNDDLLRNLFGEPNSMPSSSGRYGQAFRSIDDYIVPIFIPTPGGAVNGNPQETAVPMAQEHVAEDLHGDSNIVPTGEALPSMPPKKTKKELAKRSPSPPPKKKTIAPKTPKRPAQQDNPSDSDIEDSDDQPRPAQAPRRYNTRGRSKSNYRISDSDTTTMSDEVLPSRERSRSRSPTATRRARDEASDADDVQAMANPENQGRGKGGLFKPGNKANKSNKNRYPHAAERAKNYESAFQKTTKGERVTPKILRSLMPPDLRNDTTRGWTVTTAQNWLRKRKNQSIADAAAASNNPPAETTPAANNVDAPTPKSSTRQPIIARIRLTQNAAKRKSPAKSSTPNSKFNPKQGDPKKPKQG